ncbi:hypothetical protein C1N90_19250 [Priestia aryabhattai]
MNTTSKLYLFYRGTQKQHIHQYGKLKTPKEILTGLSIDRIDAQPLINYLTKKYEELYKL